MRDMSTSDRQMREDESIFIVDYDGRTIEVMGGINRTFEDGYSYTVSEDGRSVYQVRKDGLIDGEYDAHASLEALSRILGDDGNNSSPAP